jgi:hypothetical protein
VSDHIPLVLSAAALLYLAWVIVVRLCEDRNHIPSPQDGCCGCGADECDVVVAPDDRGRGEGYCWRCVETWPADAVPVTDLGVRVFAGRERGVL